MPEIPIDFPVMRDQRQAEPNNQVWVWDTWPMTDAHGNQYSYKGWNVIFSLTADPYAGYTFDDRHVHARISYWYRKNDSTGPWLYGGHIFGNRTPDSQAEWSGSTRIMDDGAIKVFYTHLNFADRDKPIAQIALSNGRIHADDNRVWFSGLGSRTTLLEPDGKWYQTPTRTRSSASVIPSLSRTRSIPERRSWSSKATPPATAATTSARNPTSATPGRTPTR